MSVHTYLDRPPRRGIADDARVIWIDEQTADRDGLNVDRLRAVYEPMGITIVVGLPCTTSTGEIVCPGCDVAYNRDRECWQPCSLTAGGWRPLCRKCENTEWSLDPRATERRLLAYDADPGLRTRPGTGTGWSPSWNDSTTGTKPGRRIKALGKRGRF